MTTATIDELPKITANFARPARHRVFKGGRGSGKTRGLAKRTAIYGYKLAQEGREGVLLASREHLNSLEDSSLEEIKAAIRSEPWLADYYEIGEKFVRTKNRRISYAFAGLRHNLDSIKSKSRILLNWTDEAEGVSEVAWRKLIPTIREPGSENWLSYNPENPDSATHKRFIENPPRKCIITTINWRDNPWFSAELEEERQDDFRLRPDTYDHVWEGAFLTRTDAQIFAGRFEIAEFEPGPKWEGPYQGLDWGYSQDPTAAVQVYIRDRKLYVRREAFKKRLELDSAADFITGRIAGFERHTTRADSAQPGNISLVKRYGLPRIEGVKKWAGSVEDGIEFIRSFDKVIIHPDCPEVAREFRLYSYKLDRLSGDVTATILDANNHGIDAIRYALAPMILSKSRPRARAL